MSTRACETPAKLSGDLLAAWAFVFLSTCDQIWYSWDSETVVFSHLNHCSPFLPARLHLFLPQFLEAPLSHKCRRRVADDEVGTGVLPRLLQAPRHTAWLLMTHVAPSGGAQRKRLEPKNIQYFWMSSTLKKQSPLNAPKGVCVSPSGADVNAWCEGKGCVCVCVCVFTTSFCM